MAGFEGEVAPALERIIAARSITNNEDDRAFLFNLLGLLVLRNPRQRELWRDFQERVAKQIMNLATATRERWERLVSRMRADGALTDEDNVDYDKMKQFVVEDKFSIKVPTGTHIATELKAVDAILPYIFERKWSLLKAGFESGGFVTCDHPVCLMWADPKRRGRFPPPGHGLHGTQIVFPISTGLAMIGTFEGTEETRDAPEDLIATINGTVIQFAERQVYARDQNFIYCFDPFEQPRKASKLVDDRRFGTKSKR
jgi:hypothetical protein